MMRTATLCKKMCRYFEKASESELNQQITTINLSSNQFKKLELRIEKGPQEQQTTNKT